MGMAIFVVLASLALLGFLMGAVQASKTPTGRTVMAVTALHELNKHNVGHR